MRKDLKLPACQSANSLKLMNPNIAIWGNPTLFHWAKSIEKIFRKNKKCQKLLTEKSKC